MMLINIVMSGCGRKANEEETIANPWTNSDEKGVLEATGFDLTAPVGAMDVNYSYMAESKLAEMTYNLDGASWVYRVKASLQLEDISGMNYSWIINEEGKVSGRPANYMVYTEANENTEYIDSAEGVMVVNWYDIVTGVTYSLSASGTDLNGMDIQVYAEQIYVPLQGED